MSIGVVPFAFPGVPNVRCVFQTRRGGVSLGEYGGANISHDVGDVAEHVASNRSMLMQQLGIHTWGELKQVHGNVMIQDPAHIAPHEAAHVEADGSYTDKQDLALVIKTADCQPIMLAHSSGNYVAGLHAGWRGNHIGFPVSGVKQFCRQYGIEARDVMAVRGPSLGPAAAEFVNFSSEWGASWTPWYSAETKTMNLWALTVHQLMEAGVPQEHIFSVDLCTHSLPEDFFSYRRCRESGRQASLIWIEG